MQWQEQETRHAVTQGNEFHLINFAPNIWNEELILNSDCMNTPFFFISLESWSQNLWIKFALIVGHANWMRKARHESTAQESYFSRVFS